MEKKVSDFMNIEIISNAIKSIIDNAPDIHSNTNSKSPRYTHGPVVKTVPEIKMVSGVQKEAMLALKENNHERKESVVSVCNRFFSHSTPKTIMCIFFVEKVKKVLKK